MDLARIKKNTVSRDSELGLKTNRLIQYLNYPFHILYYIIRPTIFTLSLKYNIK